MNLDKINVFDNLENNNSKSLHDIHAAQSFLPTDNEHLIEDTDDINVNITLDDDKKVEKHMKKYELVTNDTKTIDGKTLYRIRALKDFGDVKAGDLGGYIEKEDNLSHNKNAWVGDNACVYDNALIRDNAYIYGNAHVYNNACIYGNAYVYGRAWICDNARVYDNTYVCDSAWIRDNARVYGNAWIRGEAYVYGTACVYDNACIHGKAYVYGKAHVYGKAYVCDNADICDNANICGDAHVCSNARICGDAVVTKNADYATTAGFGPENSTTTFFRLNNGDIGVACGRFHSTLNEFREEVKQTHGNTKFAKEYLMLADVMELHFQ